jgi:hypothetical protein
MPRYHINSTTGVSGRCRAEKSCPFGLAIDDHYDSPAEARAAYEVQMSSGIISHSRQQLSPTQYRQIPAGILKNTPLKELDSSQLAQTLQHEAISAGMDRDTISSSVDLATILHAHQTRGNRGNFSTTPYIEHPLRNSVRLLRMGVKDQDVIIAAVLHDTIEDGAKVFVAKFEKTSGKETETEARQVLGGYIEKAYGSRVLRLVEAVTNDYIADTDKSKMTLAQKNLGYLNHVRDAIKNDPEVILVKLTDIVDNAAGLYHNDVPSRAVKTKRQAVKYRPVIDVFLEELERTKLPIPSESLEIFREQLHRTKKRLESIIAKYS